MPARISRNPLSRRAKEKEIEVVLDANSPDLGFVRLTLCELPSGQLIDLKEEGSTATDEARLLKEELSKEQEQFIDSVSGPQAEIYQEKVRLLRERRKEALRVVLHTKGEIIRWGVAAHRSEDFLDENGQEFAYQSEQEEFDTISYRVVSKSTLLAYHSLGAAFIESLYKAVLYWQSGIVKTPEEVWHAANVQQKKLLKVLLNPSTAAPSPEKETATTKTPDPSETQTNLISTGT